VSIDAYGTVRKDKNGFHFLPISLRKSGAYHPGNDPPDPLFSGLLRKIRAARKYATGGELLQAIGGFWTPP